MASGLFTRDLQNRWPGARKLMADAGKSGAFFSWFPRSRNSAILPHSPFPVFHALLSMPTILVIEDDTSIRTGVLDALEAAGYETLFAANGRDGMEIALRATFRLLLLDLVLPYVDGFTILEALRVQRPVTPVIILSAMGQGGRPGKGAEPWSR